MSDSSNSEHTSPEFSRRVADQVVQFLSELGLEARRRKVRGKDRYCVAVSAGAWQMDSRADETSEVYTRRALPETRGRRRDPITLMAGEIPAGGRGPDLTVPRSEYDRIQALISRWRNRPGGKPVYVRLLETLDDGRVVAGFFHVVDAHRDPAD